MLKTVLASAIACICFTSLSNASPVDRCPGNWDSLINGNKKFVKNKRFSNQRNRTQKGQSPCYIVLSCADSRVSPDYIFQKDIGSIFNVRVAGHVVDDVVVDSLEFAVTHFSSTTLVILGHTDCGAVSGAIKRLKENKGNIIIPTDRTSHLDAVLIPIEKAIKEAELDINSSDIITKAIQANIEYATKQLLSNSKPVSDAIDSGKIKLIKAEYDVASGKVTRLS